MKLDIRRATPADAEAISHIWTSSRRNNVIDQLCFPTGRSETDEEAQLSAFRAELGNAENTCMIVEAQDENSQRVTAAFIAWRVGTIQSLKEGKTEGGLAEIFPTVYKMDRWPVLMQFMADVDKGLEECIQQRKHILLDMVYTLPEYERKGIATMLLKLVKSSADDLSIPIMLTATPTGKGLYGRYGFRIYEEFTVDFVRHGQTSPEPYQNWVMTKEADAK